MSLFTLYKANKKILVVTRLNLADKKTACIHITIVWFTWEREGFAVPVNIFSLLLFLLTAFSRRFACKNFGSVPSLMIGTRGFPYTGSLLSQLWYPNKRKGRYLRGHSNKTSKHHKFWSFIKVSTYNTKSRKAEQTQVALNYFFHLRV